MQTTGDVFRRELEKLISDEIDRLSGNLSTPGTCVSFEAYQFDLGKIAGLRQVKSDYCDEAAKNVEKR